MQRHENHRDQNRNQAPEDALENSTHQHVGVKPDAERQQPAEIAHDLDGEHQNGQPEHWPAKVLQVARDSVVAQAMKVVIQERRHRQAKRGLDPARRADLDLKSGVRNPQGGHERQQVAHQDENEQRGEHGNVALAPVADNLLRCILGEFHDLFHNVLKDSRVFDRKSAPHDQCEGDDSRHNQQFHRQIVGNRVSRVRGGQTKGCQQWGHDARQEFIQDRCQPQFMLHRFVIIP